jgi:hypothetical protein
MRRDDIPLAFPCGVDFKSMPRVAGGRLCSACETIVHDLSSMSEAAARAVLAGRTTDRLCVRYLYDARGRVVFAGEALAGAVIVPAHSLTRKAAARLARTAMLAAPLVLFQACGGNSGGFSGAPDAEADGYRPAEPTIPDAGADAPDAHGDGGDAGSSAALDAAADMPDALDDGSTADSAAIPDGGPTD